MIFDISIKDPLECFTMCPGPHLQASAGFAHNLMQTPPRYIKYLAEAKPWIPRSRQG